MQPFKHHVIHSWSVGVLLRAFRYRNYRLFFVGQSLSLVGTWIQHTAMIWLIYRLTGSPFLLGVTAFTGQIPSLVLTPFAGVLADRWERRRLLIWTQILAMIQALVVSGLVLADAIQVWHIVALSLFLGTVNAFDIPARHSFVADVVDNMDDMGNAVALNSSMFHGSRLIGPVIAGFLIAGFGEGICFLLNGGSYLAVIAALVFIRTKPKPDGNGLKSVFREIRDGFDYCLMTPAIRSVLLLIALVSLLGMPYMVLMPVFAKDILRGGPETLGFLMASSGIGAFAGTVFLASLRGTRAFENIIFVASIIFSAGLALFSFSRELWVSLICLFFVGFGIVAQVASGNTILQAIVEEDKRGRTMGLFNMAFMGLAPFGSLIAGGMAVRVGVAYTLLACAVFCLSGSFLFLRNLRSSGTSGLSQE